MRSLSFAVSGIAAIGLLLPIASSNAAIVKPALRAPATPLADAPRASRARRQRLTATPSCSGGTEGHYAFDTSTTFSTNNVTVFGQSNLAAAGDAGALEGSGNTICDYNSVIAGGNKNVIDSGSGNTPAGAAYSFIGSGTNNVLTNSYSFIGSGYQNSNTGESSFLGAGEDDQLSGEDSIVGAGIYNQLSGTYSFVGAGYGNTASGTDSGISSGQGNIVSSDLSFIGAGLSNTVSQQQSFVGAGTANIASGSLAFIGTGSTNTASGHESFVGSGFGNVASGAGSFIGGGGVTVAKNPGNQVTGSDSFIGSGDQNTVAASNAFVGSGNLNSISSAAGDSVIVGGYGNTMTGQKASLGGGEANEVAGSFATVPGGYHDEAIGNESFAAGSQSEARYTGSFVWSDYVSGERALADSAAGEFVARASGGVYFFSNAAASTGVHLAAGSGTWSSLSDRNAKTDIVPLDDASILAKVASLPISAWRYKTESGVRHVGPMAQDFYAAFGVGEDDRHITSIDEDGVALAAIKAIDLRLVSDERRKDEAMQRLHGENARLQAKLAQLEVRSAGLTRSVDALLASARR